MGHSDLEAFRAAGGAVVFQEHGRAGATRQLQAPGCSSWQWTGLKDVEVGYTEMGHAGWGIGYTHSGTCTGGRAHTAPGLQMGGFMGWGGLGDGARKVY